MEKYNNQQITSILNVLLLFLKNELGINQKQFCEIHREEEHKLTRHRKETDERYNPETAKKYKTRIVNLILSFYQLEVHIELVAVFLKEEMITIRQKKVTPSHLFTVCRQNNKNEAALSGYIDFRLNGEAFFHAFIYPDHYLVYQGEYQRTGNILTLLFNNNDCFHSFFCINIGNSTLELSPILRGTFSGVTKENNPICGEVLLMKAKNIEEVTSLISTQQFSPILTHYFKRKRLEVDNQLIESMEELPNYESYVELSRVTGDYIGLRLSDDGESIRTTPIRICPDGTAFIKGRNQNTIYQGTAEIFMGKLLAVNTFRKGEDPFHVLSIFMVGRLSKEEIKWLNGVLTGITSDTVMPRCGREIWVKSDAPFESLSTDSILIPSGHNSNIGLEYEALNKKYNGIADFLRGTEDNLIVITDPPRKKFARKINYGQLFSFASQWASTIHLHELSELYREKAREYGIF